MDEPRGWQAEAFNEVPHSENKIHSDEIAKAHGFTGGLVPGVTVSAYLIHPAIQAWGMDWLTRGRAHVVVKKPLYDHDSFDVKVTAVDAEKRGGSRYDATLCNDDGVLCAEGWAELPAGPSEPPDFRGDPRRDRGMERETVSREVLERLRAEGMMAVRSRWSSDVELTRYTRDADEMAGPCAPGAGGYANPGFVLGLTNWALAANVYLPAWLHLQTEHQNYSAIARDSELVTELQIVDLFERKGHEFVDVELGTFLIDETPVASCRLRAIYKLRGA